MVAEAGDCGMSLQIAKCPDCKHEFPTRKKEGKVQCYGCGKRFDVIFRDRISSKKRALQNKEKV